MKKNQAKDFSWRRHYDGKRRKPLRARDCVFIALMTAFCVVSNLVCSHTIPLHAGTAVVLLSGMSMGPGCGFIIGALSRLLCNFFDGQGIWTVWQMLCWGLLGIIAGMVFYRRDPRGRRGVSLDQTESIDRTWRSNILVLTAFSFVVVFLVYGGIMNLAALFMNYAISPQDYPLNRESLMAVYATGIPYDLGHAGGTAVCMFVFGDTFLARIRRIQIKYGL